MKAFLLAAGRGTRISKKIAEIPKCTLDVGGKPLILRTVEMLLANNVDVTIIVGYKHTCIEEVLEGKDVNIVYNPFFDVTNSIGSLWMAKEYMTADDTIVANADVFWSQELLDKMIENAKTDEVFMLSDAKRADDGDYFFNVVDGNITAYGKELTREERNAEYVGIAYMRGSFMPAFKDRLEKLVEKQQHGVWWENVLYSYIGERTIHAMEVGDTFWSEIDFIEDYYRINEYIASRG